MSDALAAGGESWFEDGLHFECGRCGHCCQGEGYVWVGKRRIEAIARFLGLDPEAFGRRYLRRVGGRLSLVEKADGDCVFWDREQGCTIYEARPEQCRSFPFWPEHLASPESWRQAARSCGGIGCGRRWTVEEIRRHAGRGP